MCDSSSATRIVFAFVVVAIAFLSPPAGKYLIRQLQLKTETASLSDLALREHPPAVHGLDDLLHERQPQARALGHAVIGLCPVELLEDERQVLGRDADAG